MNPNLETLIRLLAQQAARNYLEAPEAINMYYSLNKSKRPVLIKKVRAILEKKS